MKDCTTNALLDFMQVNSKYSNISWFAKLYCLVSLVKMAEHASLHQDISFWPRNHSVEKSGRAGRKYISIPV